LEIIIFLNNIKTDIMKKLILLFVVIFITTLSSFAQFTFIHITDTHVSNTLSLVNSYDTNAQRFQCYIQEFANLSPKPAFVIASGDISNIGNQSPDGMYPTMTQYLFPPTQTNPAPGAYFIDAAKTIPIYFTPGNHEYYTTLMPPTSNATLSYYPEYIAPDSDYAITYNNAVIIFMRSGYDGSYFHDLNPQAPEGTGISDAQCHWLRNKLSANAGKRKIITFHHPAVNVAGTNSDGTPFTGTILDTADGSLLNDRTTFLNICDSNNVDVVLNGHMHQNVVADRAGNVISENCTTCRTRYVQTGAALNRSYRIITVGSSFVTVSAPLLSCNTITGINELSNTFNISVFPNPAIDNITIEAPPKCKIEILNIAGQLMTVTETAGNTTGIDISSFAKGFYFIKVQSEKGVAMKKFVKE
jgi:3',5'-cyclic AMP phosphodiesterase CpdA